MKKTKPDQIAFLEIYSYRAAWNGEHYYGHIRFKDDEEILRYPMTQTQADLFNEKDSCESEAASYKAGELTNRYFDKNTLEIDAARYFHEHLESQGATLFCVGRRVNAYPQRVIAFAQGYGALALKFNELHQLGEFCDWDWADDADADALDDICDEWNSYLER